KIIASPSSPMSIAISEDRTNKDEMSSDDESEFVLDYRLYIKTSDRVSLPAKWFKESVSTIDELLLSIYLITKDTIIMPNNYCVIFKNQRKTSAGTQLANAQDFIKFKSECTKLTTKNNSIKIYVTVIPNKRKREISDLDSDEDDNA
ncbi:8756_t:CDS:2, partial [Racocetra persica]